MYKLVVSDFDGTLVDNDLAIPMSTVLAIDSIRRKKIKFAIATGRGINFIKYYIKDVNFLDYIIALNGSYIYDVIKEKVIYEKAIRISDIKKIVKKYQDLPAKIYMYTDNSKCYLNRNKEITNEIVIRDLNDFLKCNKVYKLEIHTKTKKLRETISKELSIEQLDIEVCKEEYENKDYLVEVVFKDISKLSGTKKIIKNEKINLKDVVAFGDSYNDMLLLKEAGLSVAMANSKKEIKKLTNKRTTSNTDKGVEKGLKKIFEIE